MLHPIIICLILWLILWFLPILNALCIYYIDKYKGETFKQYIVRNNIELFVFMSFIPCVGICCMIILFLMFIVSKKYE